MLNRIANFEKLYSSHGMGAFWVRVWPHSRHNKLLRGVIMPQEGHIRCALKRLADGFSPPRTLLKPSPTAANSLRSERKRGCIQWPSALSPKRYTLG